jgi:hypothetical protein
MVKTNCSISIDLSRKASVGAKPSYYYGYDPTYLARTLARTHARSLITLHCLVHFSASQTYEPNYLDDPKLTVGKHRVVLRLPGIRVC